MNSHLPVAITDAELSQWADNRADDAGRLARELVAYRRGEVPQDVTELVVAAREFWQANEDMSEESNALDKALEAFVDRVPYENQPDDDAPCPTCGNEERGQGGYLSCECPALSAKGHADE